MMHAGMRTESVADADAGCRGAGVHRVVVVTWQPTDRPCGARGNRRKGVLSGATETSGQER